MRKLLVSALPAFTLCAVAAVVAVDRGWLRLPFASTVLRDVPALSEAEAQVHRDNGYAAIASIEQLLGLPGHFARMEALYALAGRSDAADVQNLIFQANGIADRSARRDTLLVLFTRLTELDPESALALSRTPGFGADPDYEREVWQRWGEHDLDAALRHAAGLQSAPRRNLAAQALLASYGYWGNEQTARIAESLDAEPDNRTRSARLEELARDDPGAAIEYVHGIGSPLHRRQAAAHLGRLLGRSGLAAADRYAGLFGEPGLQRAFEDAAAQAAAEVDPAGTLESLLADSGEDRSRLVAAFTAVAGQDLEQALAWFDRVRDPRQRRVVGSVLAEQLAKEEPLRALAWAKGADEGFERSIYMRVLRTLSETRPDLALADAKSLDRRVARLSAMMTVARTVSHHDPRQALALLDGVESAEDREVLIGNIAMSWLQDDPETALDWILALDTPKRSDLIAGAAHMLVRRDLDAAIRLLPRIDKDHATVWRQRIAANLAAQRSVAEARQFIAQYEGSPEYPQMMSAVIQGLAQTDAAAALEMLDRLPAGDERQMLYSSVLMEYAQQDPGKAAESLASVDDAGLRMNLTTQVLSMWGRSDPPAAERWADDLPPGKERDTAIMGVSSGWTEFTPSRRLLIESIGSAELRTQAVGNIFHRIAREDFEKAQRLLRDLNLPAAEKEQLRRQMEMVRDHSNRSHPISVW